MKRRLRRHQHPLKEKKLLNNLQKRREQNAFYHVSKIEILSSESDTILIFVRLT